MRLKERKRKALWLLAYAWPFLLTGLMESLKTSEGQRSDFWSAMPIVTLVLVWMVCKAVGAKEIAIVFSIWVSNMLTTVIQGLDLVPGPLPGGSGVMLVVYLICLLALLVATPYLYRVYARHFVTEPLNKRRLF
jgi:hypothetical protein